MSTDIFCTAEKPMVESAITFHTGSLEMLKVAEDGFYVRGVKVSADDNEARSVYNAFKQFLVWHGLTRPY